MDFIQFISAMVLFTLLGTNLVACGGSSSGNVAEQEPPVIIEPPESIPSNTISHAYFRDQDGASNMLAGTVKIIASQRDPAAGSF